MALSNSGGSNSAPNKAPAQKVIEGALSNRRVARNLIAALGSHSVAAAIVATNVSQTIDFGALAIGDIVVHIPAVAGGAVFVTVAAAGTLPVAAVVGDLYVALRAVNLDSDLVPSSLE